MTPFRNSFFVCSILIATLCSHPLFGQDVENVLQKYKSEQAVITRMNRKLVIEEDDGALVAKSYITTEKLLIGDMSPGVYNKEYIFHSYFNKLEDYDAFALVPGKKGYVRNRATNTKSSRYDESNVFYDDVQELEISFSGLAPGSLLQNSYTLSHTDIHMLPSFYFQENMPVAHSAFEVTVPKYVHIKFVIKGGSPDKVIQTTEEKKNTITYKFTADDVPALRHYDYVASSDRYTLHVIPYIQSYKLPGDKEEQVVGDVAHLYQYLHNFLKNVNTAKDSGIAQVAAMVTKGDKTELEKAAHIYKWVQDNIHYIAFEDSLEGYIPRQAAAICKRKFGDCKDMASILVALCREAGINAYFTWIGTSSRSYTYEETPIPAVANHMICTIKVGDQWIFMDGTHPLIPFGKAPSSIQDKEALIGISDQEYKIITVPEADAASNAVYDTAFLSIDDKKVNGRTSIHFEGYASWELQSDLIYRKNEARDKYLRSFLERGSNKYFQKSYEYKPVDTGNKPCTLTADFVLDDYVQKVGNEYFINLNLKPYFDDNYIDTTGRTVPEYFLYKATENDVVVLDIPAGYHVSYLPPEISGQVGDIWDYKIRYRQEGRKVILTKDYVIRSMTLPANYFIRHNNAVEELRKQNKETVVLTAD